MPLVVGSALLMLSGQTLGVLHAPLERGQHPLLPEVVADAAALLRMLDWHRWQTYVFLYLALSIGAELAPSATDLRHGLPALLGVLAGMWLFFFAVDQAPGLAPVGIVATHLLERSAAWLSQVWTATLAMTGAAAAVLLLPGLLLRALRQ
jgi:hypothetical protein